MVSGSSEWTIIFAKPTRCSQSAFRTTIMSCKMPFVPTSACRKTPRRTRVPIIISILKSEIVEFPTFVSPSNDVHEIGDLI